MALNTKKAQEKNEADKLLEEMAAKEESNSVTATIENLTEAQQEVKKAKGNEPKKKSASPPKPKEKKHPGGRPTNESKGKISRKQYTLTLVPDDYSKIMDLADADGLSFSKYIERAVNEYISNHQTE